MEIAPDDHPREFVNYEIQEDGEFLTIWTENDPYDHQDDIHTITMTRDVAIQLANEILEQMTFKEED